MSKEEAKDLKELETERAELLSKMTVLLPQDLLRLQTIENIIQFSKKDVK